ncbi:MULTISPECIES: ArsR/SmtB family transcription factor [Micromonospora]|uniref:DNA-binding transcriptional regulator, ArsR family n=1 Tax=Micromonospora yangpuensis TaxID=683228 RepID=A0A1C6UUB0_9ACTN|nr:metalloregulator ArsR/SmtB family transcription factor [Micromonospora yangpuensis]GGM24197.1 transcriptional regulator [Micromonospora yangpuensis]SCL57632.1 DNA-binding transcriptional regulator, ArsR family [Micromonospora yangpuensis]
MAPDQVDVVFAALANPTRRELLGRLLTTNGQPVQQLAAHFSMTRPSVSEHLRVLRHAGLVTCEQVGRQRFYRLDHDALYPVQEWLRPYERFWRDRLRSMSELLDAETEDGPESCEDDDDTND